MKRFMVACLAISAVHCFAAEDGGEQPSSFWQLFGPAACMVQAAQGAQVLLQDAVAHPRIVVAMQSVVRVVTVVLNDEDNTLLEGDSEAGEGGVDDFGVTADGGGSEDITDAASDISPDNNSLSDAMRERIAGLQANIVKLEEELARRRHFDEEDVRRALNNEH